MNVYDLYIYFIVFIKICFIICAFTHFYYIFKGEKNSKKDKEIVNIKEHFEFIFIVLMALLLIYTFNPRLTKPLDIDNETRFLFYAYGFVLI